MYNVQCTMYMSFDFIDCLPGEKIQSHLGNSGIVLISHHLISADSLELIPPTIGNQSRKCSRPISGQSRYKSRNKQFPQRQKDTSLTFESVEGSTWVAVSGNIPTILSPHQLDGVHTADAPSLGMISLPCCSSILIMTPTSFIICDFH